MVAFTALAFPGPASADINIRQIHPSNAMFGGDWVELQFTASGESVVGKHILTFFSTGGPPNSDFLIPGEVANNQSQRTVLISSAFSPAGEDADFTGNVELIGGDGAACLTGPSPALTLLDCVAYGNFTAPGFPVGTPAVQTEFDETLQRTITRGCPTALDDADDTNNSAADFALSTREPRNNATAPTEQTCEKAGVGGNPSLKCRGETATLRGTASKDKLKGTQKRDVIAAGGGNDIVSGLKGNDVICGEDGKDTLRGGNGKDLLAGGKGADLLAGGARKDKLLGQAGKDVCKGGAAADTATKCETEKTL